MKQLIKPIKVSDGHVYEAYITEPETLPKGAIVVIHEIYGLTQFIKSVCQQWSEAGYLCLAPSLFDRLERNICFEESHTNIELALEYKARLMALTNTAGLCGWELQLYDIAACFELIRKKYRLPIAVTGFCWGGTLAWLTACRFEGLSCVSSYYGTGLYQFIDEIPRCPTMLHTGIKDEYLTPEDVSLIKEKHPDVLVYTYAAGHGFRRPHHPHYNEDESALADRRTQELFKHYLFRD